MTAGPYRKIVTWNGGWQTVLAFMSYPAAVDLPAAHPGGKLEQPVSGSTGVQIMGMTLPETSPDQDGFHTCTEFLECAAAIITVTIGLPTGVRLLAAKSERSAAAYAEAVVYATPRAALPVPLSVSCADPGVRNRLTTYLLDLQQECLRVPAPRRNASGALG